MHKTLLTALAAGLVATSAAQAADIHVGTYFFGGGSRIRIQGEIVAGDEARFRQVLATAPADAVVSLNSRGGAVVPAIAIGREIRARGLTTVVAKLDVCASACTFIWLAGKHSIVQRDAFPGFRGVAVNGNPSPEGNAFVASYLREIGMTPAQINYALSTPQPAIQVASEADAMALGIHLQPVPSLLGAWRACSARFCLAIP
jgi:hypothetical protein